MVGFVNQIIVIAFPKKAQGGWKKFRVCLQAWNIDRGSIREGKTRSVYVLESVAPIFRSPFDPSDMSSLEEKKAYLRGFFDAEGGIPKSLYSKRYVQLAQKDYKKIDLLKRLLLELDILTGRIHNPSKRVDPDYWRI